MKNYLLVGALLVLSISAFAQTSPGAADNVVDEKKKVEFYDSYEEFQERTNKHWQGFDIGINGLAFEDGSDVPPTGYEYLRLDYGRSFYFGVNLFEVGLPINGELIKVVTGLGFDFNNFQLRGNSYMYNLGDTLTEVRDTTFRFKKNNMKNSHITVPLLLAFNTSPKNSSSFHIAFGVIGSYRIAGRQKVQWYQGDICHTVILKSDMLQNPWRVQGTVRLGYANFHIFGNYSLTEYWRSGSGPKANMWSMGIKVIPW